MFYLLSLDEIRAGCFGMSVWGHLCVCTLLLSADWSFGIRPSTPKWTLGATHEGYKHKQLIAGLSERGGRKIIILIIHIYFESFCGDIQQMHFRLLRVLLISEELNGLWGEIVAYISVFQSRSLSTCNTEAGQLRNQKSLTARKMDLCWVAC